MAKLHVLGSSSLGNCYLLETRTGILVLEAGVKFKEVKQYMNFDLSRVQACLITHEHGDHSKYFADFLKHAIPVFTSRETREVLEPARINRNLYAFENMREIQIGQFKIKPLAVAHDVHCFAFMINHSEFGTLVFATDTYLFPYKIKANYWLIEANYCEDILIRNIESGKLPGVVSERVFRSHMSINTTCMTLKKQDLSDCKEIVLIHLSDGNSNEKQFIEKVEGCTGMKPYIPSNGTEGMMFTGKFCDNCSRDTSGRGGKTYCNILTKSLIGIQPKQWVYDNEKPVCTSFVDYIERKQYKKKYKQEINKI
jgi:phosphoribosyl 1,2-cyclic phosphodiesterase